MESSRKKSCKQCRIAKTRCNRALPLCSRCESRRLPCKYEPQVRSHKPPPPRGGGSFHSWATTTNSTSTAAKAGEGAGLQVEQGKPSLLSTTNLGVPESVDFNLSAIPALEGDFVAGMPWDDNSVTWPMLQDSTEGEGMSAEQHLGRFLESTEEDLQNSISWFEFASGTPVHTEKGTTPQLKSTMPTKAKDQTDILSDVSLAMSRSSNVIQASWDALKKIRNTSPNLLNRKEDSTMSSLMTGNLQWATIQSYVTAFADGILPPFIHRSCAVKSLQGQNTEHSDLPESLANCRSVVEMYLK
jgi:hypothetical protein